MKRLFVSFLFFNYCICMDAPENSKTIADRFIEINRKTYEKETLSQETRKEWRQLEDECYQELILLSDKNEEEKGVAIRIFGKVLQIKNEYSIPLHNKPVEVFGKLLDMYINKDSLSFESLTEFLSYIQKLEDEPGKKLMFLDDLTNTILQKTEPVIRANLKTIQKDDYDLGKVAFTTIKGRKILELVEQIKRQKIKLQPDRRNSLTPERVDAWQEQRKLEDQISPRVQEEEKRKKEKREVARPSQLLKWASTILLALEKKIEEEKPCDLEITRLKKIRKALKEFGSKDDLATFNFLKDKISPRSTPISSSDSSGGSSSDEEKIEYSKIDDSTFEALQRKLTQAEDGDAEIFHDIDQLIIRTKSSFSLADITEKTVRKEELLSLARNQYKKIKKLYDNLYAKTHDEKAKEGSKAMTLMLEKIQERKMKNNGSIIVQAGKE